VRESPALNIVRELLDKKVGELLVVEPYLDKMEGMKLVPMDQALNEADIIVFLVPHSPFKKIRAQQLAEKITIDTCGVLHGR
jgi:UDP-N-acetyl-D-mannosaminuronic acid dehydrogenase